MQNRFAITFCFLCGGRICAARLDDFVVFADGLTQELGLAGVVRVVEVKEQFMEIMVCSPV
jgi:hypothetical protein